MLNFLQENNITDMIGLDARVRSMHEKQIEIRDKIKPVERRLKTLDEHIEQAESYMQYKAVYRQYKELTLKKQAAFAEKQRMEVTLFESAERYVKGVMNGKTTLPIKAWKTERDALATKKRSLNREYVSLKNEVGEVEQIRRSVYALVHDEPQRKQPERE
jgi:transcriptional accessory protein Tex/SPT6